MIKSPIHLIFLYLVSLTHFAFAEVAEVFEPLDSKEQVLELCHEEEIHKNIIASKIFGDWQMDNNITSALGEKKGGLDEDVDIQINFQADNQAMSFFTPMEGSYSCVYAQGRYSMTIKVDEDGLFYVSGPFIVLYHNGNAFLLLKDEEGDYLPKQYLSIGYAPNPANDILFLGRESGCDKEDVPPNYPMSLEPKAGCSGNNLIDVSWAYVRN